MTEVERILQEHGYSASDGHRAELIAELQKINGFVQELVTAAQTDEATARFEDEVWEKVFDVVFSGKVSKRAFRLYGDITGRGFDYYDPDTTYKEDVIAFAKALQEEVAEFAN